jgi:sugar lactone lactonase YvrE
MRRTLLVALFGLALVLPFAAGAASPFPERIDLPNGFRPEGIAIGPGHTFYVGSIPTGAVVRGDLRTGTRSPLVPAQAGRAAIGVDVDNRGRLFVAGGPTGHGYVYDANTGANIADYDFTVGDPATFVNDVVVTRTAAWFTDSVNQFLYRIAIAPNGTLGPATAVPLTGDIAYQAGFNVNGVEATANGKTLVIVQSNTGQLFRVDTSGVASQIDVGGAFVPGDGLVLDGKTLYAVVRSTPDGRVPADGVMIIALRPDLSSGVVVRTIMHPGLDDPTTIDEFGSRLYAVNGRFSTPPTPSTPYWLTQLHK